jgi:uncharacterized protein (DUF58 family)
MSSYRGVKPNITELLKNRLQAKRLKIFANQRVNSVNAGANLSRSKGKGMDFDEVRHYQPGDDIRLMHWGLTARLGKPFTKVYHEEKDRALYFVIDQSSTMRFGTRECFKSVKAANVLALMGFGAIGSHEKVGGVIFDETGISYYRANHSTSSLLRMFNLLSTDDKQYQFKSQDSLTGSLKLLYSKIKSNSVVIVVSDFSSFTSEASQYLKLLARKSQTINMFCYDVIEKELPNMGVCNLSNDNDVFAIDTQNTKQRASYQNIYDSRLAAIRDFSKQYRMGFIKIATNDDLVKKINRGVASYAS